MKLNAADRARLVRIVGCFRGAAIVVLGDLVADEFVYGQIARVSREAPVLILKQREKQILPGGGANAANNLADLGVQVTLVGAAGEDEAGEALLRYFAEKGVETEPVLRPKEYRTPTKSRVLGAIGHGRPQQIVRVDREPAAPLPAGLRRRLTQAASTELARSSAVLVSDYGYGATSAREIDWLQRRGDGRAKQCPPITLDSRYDLRSYAGVTAATPNEQEIEQAFGAEIGDRIEALNRLAGQVLKRQRFQALLVTRGREGMMLYEPGRAPEALSIFGSDQVADVTGAGDTVIAVFTAALAVGAGFLDAARLANCAGGLVVMKSGTATVTASELAEAIRNA
ncbi:MAG TPA: PfkB family carbohydrate kinase [Terriglobia bacterium]|nr:PfkB family carbohydrate kinase [Terriglobia bacterium]